jgi:hypothetical protein
VNVYCLKFCNWLYAFYNSELHNRLIYYSEIILLTACLQPCSHNSQFTMTDILPLWTPQLNETCTLVLFHISPPLSKNILVQESNYELWSVTRHFLCNIWRIELALFFSLFVEIFCYSLLFNVSAFLTRSVPLIPSILFQHHISKRSRNVSTFSNIPVSTHQNLFPKHTTSIFYSLNFK